MKWLVLLTFSCVAGATSSRPTDGPTPYVTGNGFGYAVISPRDGSLIRFFDHPNRFVKPDPSAPKGQDGIDAENLILHANWTDEKQTSGATQIQYVDQTHVISVLDKGHQQQSFFMPFGLHQNAVVTTTDSVDACLKINWANPVVHQQSKKIDEEEVSILRFEDVESTLIAVPLDSATSPTPFDPKSSCWRGHKGWAFLAVDHDSQIEQAVRDLRAWRKKASLEDLKSQEIQTQSEWRKSNMVCLASEDEQKLYRQSETVLRMAQNRIVNTPEVRGYGLINASLPDGEWFIPWVRDMAFSTVALVRSGHREEADSAIKAWLNAGPMKMQSAARNMDYQISLVRYLGTGQEDADFSEQVRPNIEFDNWGEALWAMGEYYKKFPSVNWLNSPTAHGSLYENTKNRVVMPLLGNLDSTASGLIVAKDSSIWEQNSLPYKHYAMSTATAIAGLENFLPMAKAIGDQKTVSEVETKIKNLRVGFREAFVRDGFVHGTKEPSPKNDVDGAMLEAINMGAISDPGLIQSTVAHALQKLKTSAGGFQRVLGTTPYEKQEFVFTDFSMARVLLRLGRIREADEIVQRVVKKANADGGLIPEMYVTHPTQELGRKIDAGVGAKPMVGFGAGAYILYLAERAVANEKTQNGKLKVSEGQLLDLSASVSPSPICPLSVAPISPPPVQPGGSATSR